MGTRDNVREKIKQSATAKRLLRSIVIAAVTGAFCLLLAALFLAFWKTPAGVASAAVAALAFSGGCLRVGWCAAELRWTMKNADKYFFAVTETAFFECWGFFLAMNVTFRDDTGTLREGRTRFLFNTRDVEAWQEIPLEIAYQKPFGSSTGRRKKKSDERIVVVGGAPREKINKNI